MIKIGKILFEIFEKMLGGDLLFWLSVARIFWVVGFIGVNIGKIKYISHLNLYNCTLLPTESWVLTENNGLVVVFTPEWWFVPTTTDQCSYNTVCIWKWKTSSDYLFFYSIQCRPIHYFKVWTVTRSLVKKSFVCSSKWIYERRQCNRKAMVKKTH